MIKLSKEVKIIISDKTNIIEKLRNNNAILLGGNKEKTVRYDDKNMNYEKKGKFIRVRTGFKNIISLKEKIDNPNEEETNIFKRRNVEVEIGDVNNMKYILESIGLKPVLTMEKYRLKWLYNGNILNLDELPFGLFLEIHGSEEEISKIISELGLDKEELCVETYWDIFERYKKENKIYNTKNIKFEEGYSYILAR